MTDLNITGNGFETVTIYADEKVNVVAFFHSGKFMWTTTYILNEEGESESAVRVYSSGDFGKLY